MSGPQPDEPNYFVLIAPGADSNDPNPDWVDVSTDLRAVEIIRGADKHLDQDQPGTVSIVLDNYGGDYDNDNSSSPYAGQLVADMRVRVLAEWDGDLYERFNGYLDDISLEYPDGDTEAWAILRATDAFKVLAGTALPSSAYAAEVELDGPVAWYRLNEPEGSTVLFDSSGNHYDLDVNGTPEFGEQSLIARDPETSTGITDATSGGDRLNPVITNGPLTVEMVFRRTSVTAAILLFGQVAADVGPGFALQDRPDTGNFRFIVIPAVGSNHFVDSVTVSANDVVYHLAGVWEADGDLKIYVNGVDDTDTPDNVAIGSPFGGSFAIAAGQFGYQESEGVRGVYDEVAIYDQALSAERIAAHAAAVTTPWDADIPSQRAHRICDFIGWPDLLRDFEEGLGQTTLQPAVTDGQSALDHLLTVAASEFGELHVTKEGAIKLVARHSLINRDQLADFGPAADEIRYRQATFSSGADLIRNPVTVSRLDGVAQTAIASAAYYPHHFTLEGLFHDSDELSRSAAEFLLSEYKDQKRRITGLSFGPFDAERLADWFPLLLEAELGDVYQVTFHPPNGDDLVQLSVLEGTTESWSAVTGVGEFSWNLSRAYAGSFWQLAVHGRSELGDTTRLYF